MIDTNKMEILLMNYFDIRRNLIVPCVTDRSDLTFFEIDLLVLSESKYATGIEIKVSKSDLQNDLNKKHIKKINEILPTGGTYLHHYFKNLKYFYYAVPEELKEDTLNQIPGWAGLLIAKKYVDEYHITEIRKPKLLFNTKWTDEMRYQLARLGTMRILTLKEKLDKICI
ncbi:MAG: hypothetical protein IIC75_03305 [Bacteroidetes bacterium]|nr:hypothetical protein [Bacteroidota bacterium]